MQYIGLWHGGHSYSEGYWATDAESFDSLDHAKHVMRVRWLGVRAPRVRVVDWADDGTPTIGAVSDSLTPAVDDSAYLLLAPMTSAHLDALETDGPYACSHIVEISARGVPRVTRL